MSDQKCTKIFPNMAVAVHPLALDIAIHKIQYINQFSPLRWVFNYQNFIVYSNYYIKLSTREKHALPDVHSFDVWAVGSCWRHIEHRKHACLGMVLMFGRWEAGKARRRVGRGCLKETAPLHFAFQARERDGGVLVEGNSPLRLAFRAREGGELGRRKPPPSRVLSKGGGCGWARGTWPPPPSHFSSKRGGWWWVGKEEIPSVSRFVRGRGMWVGWKKTAPSVLIFKRRGGVGVGSKDTAPSVWRFEQRTGMVAAWKETDPLCLAF